MYYMTIIDGKKISEKILNKLDVKKQLKLAVVLVGDDPNSKIYVRKKKEACERIGIDFELFEVSGDIQEVELIEEIEKVVKDNTISGIVVQLPLPEHINTDKILKLIPEEKDVESVSPVVCAIDHILEEYNISLENRKIVLIGKGRLVGNPVAEWLSGKGLSFSGIEDIQQADIIISGAGQPNLIKKDMVKQGAIVIDVGGDVSSDVSEKAGYMTPAIGGVGPVTIACLLENLIRINK